MTGKILDLHLLTFRKSYLPKPKFTTNANDSKILLDPVFPKGTPSNINIIAARKSSYFSCFSVYSVTVDLGPLFQA